MMAECQYIGPEQAEPPYTHCGREVFPGKSYCQDHVWVVYKKNTNVGNKKKLKEIEKELAEVKRLQEIAEYENE
jgi:hypothetical protein